MRNLTEIPIFPKNEIPSPEENSDKNKNENQNPPIDKKFNPLRRKFLRRAAEVALITGAGAYLNYKHNPRTIQLLESLGKYLDSSPEKENLEKKNIPEEKELSHPENNSEEHPSIEMQNLAIEIQSISHQLEENDEILPRKLFTKNFFIAVQIQESNLKRDAESEAGALGIMQIKPVTIKEVVRYLNILEKRSLIKFDGPQKIKDLSRENIEELSLLIKQDPNLGQAFGKIYFADLFDNFKIGQDIYQIGGITKARKKLLSAYNWNPEDFKKNETNEKAWPPETQAYYKKIFKYMDIIKEVQVQMNKLEIKTSIYELSAILTVELRKYEREINSDRTDFEEIIKEITSDYLKDIREMEQIKGAPLRSHEMKRLIKSSNKKAYKNFLVNRS